MMPLPTYQRPRYETESRIPAATRRALRWEGVTGTLPRAPPAWRLLLQRWLAPARAPETAPAPPSAAPTRAPTVPRVPRILQELPAMLRPDAPVLLAPPMPARSPLAAEPGPPAPPATPDLPRVVGEGPAPPRAQ